MPIAWHNTKHISTAPGPSILYGHAIRGGGFLFMTNQLGKYVRIDLSGQRFGTATILPEFMKMPNGGTQWKYRCDCGNEDWAWAEVLKRQPDFCCKECRRKVQRVKRTTHGMKYTPIYRAHSNIKTRTTNEYHKSYVSYGARGIKMCSGMQKFEDFQMAISHLGPCPDDMTIDRIENNGHYSCGKCSECLSNGWSFNLRWATDIQQANNRRTNVRIPFEGKNLTLSEWSREKGIDKTTIRKRLKLGWPPERILSLDGTRKAA